MQDNKNKVYKSLVLKFSVILIMAFVIGAMIFMFINSACTAIIEKFYMRGSMVDARMSEYFEQFQLYVTDKHISSFDYEAIGAFSDIHPGIQVYLYRETPAFYNALRPDAFDRQNLLSSPEIRTVVFEDSSANIAISDNSASNILRHCEVLSAIISLIAMAAFIMRYFLRVVSRIKRINEQIELVNAGELNRDIESDGRDELALLSQSAENMRRAIIAHYEKEQKAYRSNTALMTAISHDIRTPLTSLLLYSDALADGKVDDADKAKKYAGICRDKARQLKDMTDSMFRYFLLFGETQDKVKFDNFNASELIVQIIGEQSFILSQSGYDVNTVFPENECVIYTDAALLNRVFDNVFSNIKKYADKSKPINISLSADNAFLRISVINYISQKKNQAQSTSIGLKSAQRIMESLGGTFEYSKNNSVFEAVIFVKVAQ